MNYRLTLLSIFIGGAMACQTGSKPDLLFTPIRSAESGITFNNQIHPFENDTLNANTYDPMYNGAGVGVGDFDRDGRQDVFFAGNRVTSRLYLNRTTSGSQTFRFEDVTTNAGVTTTSWCTGVSVADVNQDGWPDIYVSVAGPDTSRAVRHNLLFINQGVRSAGAKRDSLPTFREMAAEYGLADSGMNTQAAFFDYDRDGDLDCYILNNAVERTGRNTIRPRRLNGEGPSTDRLYRCDGAGNQSTQSSNQRSVHYTDVSREAGILAEGYGLGLTIADLNEDGWPDIYCANDFLSNDIVYINNRNGGVGGPAFTNRAATYFKHTSYNSMGVDIQDINNDTRPDVMVVDMLPESNARQKMMLIKTNWEFFHLARQQGYQDEYVRNTLQLNQGVAPDGQPVFSEIGQLAGVFRTDWSWAPLLADFDNDGFKDLFVTNGYRRDITNLDYVAYLNSQASSFGRLVAGGSSQKQTLAELYKLPDVKLHNYLFRNNGGNLTFEDKSEDWGLGEPTYSNGAAYADLDNDGDLDLVVNNMDDEAGLYRNETVQPDKPITRHSIRLQLPADAHGLGAQVRVRTPDGMMQTVEVHPVRGYASSIEPFVHTGLDKHTTATVSVRWADGTYQELGSLTADRLHRITYQPTLASPPAPAVTPTLFSTLDAAAVGLTFRHRESVLNDFERTPLLPQVYGKNSPALAIADADGNGLDDVFVGADPEQTRSLFLQTSPGRFTERVQGANDLEDMGSLFFDADGDGDQDLYVVSGGSQQPDSSAVYQDRLYLNDGTGKLTRSAGALPITTSSGSCVVAADFDGDGDLDLFRAGRVKVGQYPMAPRSYLFRNDQVQGMARFTDVTDQLAPGLRTLGMICAALWTDYDNDADPDLLLAGEFMPITLLKNTHGKLAAERITLAGEQPQSGLWNSLTGADFDRDGDIDYLVGNLGQNTRYRVSADQPLRLYAKDFDGNGQLDPILTHYLQGEEHIAPIRDVLNDQMPTFARKRFTSFQAYANRSFKQAFDRNDLDGATVLTADELSSCYLENKGKGQFALHPLPMLAQVSPVFGMQTGDFNGDGLTDALLVGNSYASETYSGWYDAGRGCLLLGDGQGHFRAVSPDVAGIHADQDAKALAAISIGEELWYLVSNNNGPVQLLKPKTPVKPQPARPQERYRLVKHRDGRTQRVEFYWGSGYLSQSSK
ncbi:VCBS repeat-containing protein [Spirosoma taeanense]|uniref:VCBS repeat-containing protein n=1 Tax=Spirosoma taeanense TaxID=2735870 RepID=A0A6M5Y9U4_9BACT|nr:VCBS repeat-containing protein [Spirosoma taeanense]QJW91007.1 VCBS repeat-containing protein [Spirosoma taeanense]